MKSSSNLHLRRSFLRQCKGSPRLPDQVKAMTELNEEYWSRFLGFAHHPEETDPESVMDSDWWRMLVVATMALREHRREELLQILPVIAAKVEALTEVILRYDAYHAGAKTDAPTTLRNASGHRSPIDIMRMEAEIGRTFEDLKTGLATECPEALGLLPYACGRSQVWLTWTLILLVAALLLGFFWVLRHS